MTAARTTIGILAAVLTAGAGPTARQTAAPAAPPAETRESLLRHGLLLGYNLDYPEALAVFEDAIAKDPQDSTAQRFAGICIWTQLLAQQGAVTAEDYLGQVRETVERRPADEKLTAAFRAYSARALALAERRVRARPDDAEAHYQLGAAEALIATYTATIEGSVRRSAGNARRAYAEHKRCMKLDPSRKEAGMIVGSYQYTVAGLSLPLRLLAKIAGLDSGRESGLRLVEEAARHPSMTQSNALLTLVLLYNREGRHDDALRVIRQLQERHPRNRLLWLEEAGTALRARRPAEALRALDSGLAKLAGDTRPRAFGEEARWCLLRGTALVALRDTAGAARELEAALRGEAQTWVRGRARLERGKLADLAGNRAAARTEYARALQDCRASRDSVCAEQSTQLLRTPYR